MTASNLIAASTLDPVHMAVVRSTVAQAMRMPAPCSQEGVLRLERTMRIALDEMACLVSDLEPERVGEACGLAMAMLAAKKSPVAIRLSNGRRVVAPYARRWMGQALAECPEISREQCSCAMRALYPERKAPMAMAA